MRCEYREKTPRFVHSSDSVYVKVPDEVEKIAFIYLTDEDKFLKLYYENKVDSIKMEKGEGKILEIDTRNVKNFLITTKYKIYPNDRRKIAFTIKGMVIYYKNKNKKFVEVHKFKNYIEINGLHNPEGYFYKYESNFSSFLNALAGNWDANWFRQIAEKGYKYDGNYKKQQNPQFLPLYPLISKIFSIFTHLPIKISLIFINNLFSLLALIVIFKLTYKLYDKEIAKKR